MPAKVADRSVSDGVTMSAGACVSWFSRTQKWLTLSTTETEYGALADIIKEVAFSRYVWSYILPRFGTTCVVISEDNEGAKNLALNPACTSNSKHMRHHFWRQHIFKGEFVVTHIESNDQHADFLTKPLDYTAFCYHQDSLMHI